MTWAEQFGEDEAHGHKPPPPPPPPPPREELAQIKAVLELQLGVADATLQALKDLSAAFTKFVKEWETQSNPRSATKLTMTVRGGHPMSTTFTVDTTDGAATLQFVDDHGDPTSGPADSVTGAAIVPALSSDNDAVLSVGPAGAGSNAGETIFPLVPAAIGVANLTPQPLLNSDGSPVLDAEGNAFGVPSPVQVTVEAGPAASLTLSVTG